MNHNITSITNYLLEHQRVFSQSLLWDLQRRYFAEKGVEAWQQGEVPHYVTSNPTVAYSYAEIVFGLWQDHRRLAAGEGNGDEPLYLCELGAGSGRFAYHFLRQLTCLCEQAGTAPAAFRYVLTDYAQRNLDFWRQHPSFQPFFASGLLDMALFDITQSDQLALQVSGETITPRSLHCPLVVIANYVFDSIPQDLYYFDQEGQCFNCLASLSVDENPASLNTAELLAHLQVDYEYRPLDEAPYPESYLQELLAGYQHTLTETHLFFPATGLRCLERLQSLSTRGALLLSADKGDHRLSAWQGRVAPSPVRHGSFSLTVNYHALKTFCESHGGIALFPGHHYTHINVGCFLLLDDAASYTAVQCAYQRHVRDYGPDEFYTLSKKSREHLAEMSVAEILAYVRLSHYDSHLFAQYLPRLQELAPALDQDERQAVLDVIEQVWDGYFPLGEAQDLASQMAYLLYALDDYARALLYFEHSLELYGPQVGTLYNLAVCHHMLGQHEQAEHLLRTVVQHDPDHQQARALLAHYQRAERDEALI